MIKVYGTETKKMLNILITVLRRLIEGPLRRMSYPYWIWVMKYPWKREVAIISSVGSSRMQSFAIFYYFII